MKSYEFKFDIDEKVVSPVTGETGIVSMCAIDDGRNPMYFVKSKDGEKWWPERHLDAVGE
jgi:hypothetical protein